MADAVLQVFVFREGSYIGSELFTEEEVVVGRGERANLSLDDEDVSPEHLLLTVEDDVMAMLRLGSGIVLLNGVPVDHARLSPRDEIRLGSHALKIKILPAQPLRTSSPPVSFYDEDTHSRGPVHRPPALEPDVEPDIETVPMKMPEPSVLEAPTVRATEEEAAATTLPTAPQVELALPDTLPMPENADTLPAAKGEPLVTWLPQASVIDEPPLPRHDHALDPVAHEIAVSARQNSAIEITGADVLSTLTVPDPFAGSVRPPRPPPASVPPGPASSFESLQPRPLSTFESLQPGPASSFERLQPSPAATFDSGPPSAAPNFETMPPAPLPTFDGVWDDAGAEKDEARLEAALDSIFTVLEPTSPGWLYPVDLVPPAGEAAPEEAALGPAIGELIAPDTMQVRVRRATIPGAERRAPAEEDEDEGDLLPGFSLSERLIASADAANVTVLEEKHALEVIAFNRHAVLATALMKRRSERYVIGKRLPKSEHIVQSHGALRLARVSKDGVAQVEFPSSAEGTVSSPERSFALDELKVPSNAVSRTGDLYRTELTAGTSLTLSLGDTSFHLRFVHPPAIPKGRRSAALDPSLGPSLLSSLGMHLAVVIVAAILVPSERFAGARTTAGAGKPSAREVALVTPRRILPGATPLSIANPPLIPGSALEPPGQPGLRPSRPIGPVVPPETLEPSGDKKIRIAKLGAQQVESKGSLSREEIALVIDEHLTEVESCFAKAKGPRIGKVVMEWTIDNDGSVVKAKQKPPPKPDVPLDACLVATVGRWMFPEPPKPTPVSSATFLAIDPDAAAAALKEPPAGSDPKATIAALEESLRKDPGNERLHFALGRALFAQKRFDPAVAHYSQAIALEPSFAPAYLGRGQAEERLGQTQKARTDYGKAAALDPNLVAAHIARGKLDLDVGRMRSAQRALSRALKIAPKDPIARHDLGLLYLRQRHDADALTELDRAVEAQPDLAEAHNNRGIALARMRKNLEALQAFERAAELRPKDRDFAFNVAEVHLLNGDFDRARKELVRVLGIDPKSPDVRFHLAEIELANGSKDRAFAMYREALRTERTRDTAVDLRVARAYLERGEPERAAMYLQKALPTEASDAAFYDLLGMAESMVGTPSALEAAEAAFLRATELDPASAAIWARLARVEARLERAPRAEKMLRAVLETEPGNRDATLELGRLLESTGGTERAKELYTAAIARQPSFAEAYYQLGRIHRAKRERKAERAAYVSALLVDPAHLEARTGLGRSYFEAGESDRAIDELQRAIAIDPSHAPAHLYLANAYAAAEFNEEARTELGLALEANPELMQAHQALGALEQKVGNLEAARNAYQRALNLDPQNREVAAAIALVERALARGPEPVAPAPAPAPPVKKRTRR